MDLLDIPRSEARSLLLETILRESVRFGDFTLSSGAKSDHYVDLRRTTTHPVGAVLVARLLLEKLVGSGVEAVGGPTLGADPIVGAMAAVSALAGTPLRAFIVRSDAKAHGMQRRVEGHLEPGWRVAVLDDVVTGGGSIGRAIQAVQGEGAVVARVLTVIDRRIDRGTLGGLPLDAIFTIDEVLHAQRG